MRSSMQISNRQAVNPLVDLEFAIIGLPVLREEVI